MDFSVYFFSANDRHDFGARYEFIMNVAKFIDQAGFHAIWTPERHFQEFGGSFPNPAVLSAAIAAVTDRIELRAGSVVLPHHHPVRVVEEWALVDQLSRGRAGICLATGWHKGDFVFYPDRYAGRRDYTFQHVSTLRALWRGESVSFAGPEGSALEVRTYPRPCRPELPLWLVHSSNPQTWITAAELDLNVLTLIDSWERLDNNIRAYRDARERCGLDPQAGVVTVGLHTYLGDDEEEVRDLVAEPVRTYLDSFLQQKRDDAKLEGTSAAATESEHRALAQLVADDFYQRRSLLGTTSKCAETVRRLAGIGVDEVACLVDFGLPFETVLAALPKLDELRRMFASGTAPAPAATPSGTGPLTWYYDR